MTYMPSDPLFAAQWHLQNNKPGLLDLNVVDVWDDYTGAGVDVAVIDDGLQRSHPDLDGNYSIAKDWDFDNNDTDPSGKNGDNHGTSVAGIVSANEGNGIGGVGVAFGSTLFGFQSLNFQSIVNAINYASEIQPQGDYTADVANISLGNPRRSYFDQTLNKSVMAELNVAIDNAARNGRNGLGTIIVKSAGNDRALNQDTNASSWNANPRTISVAAVDQNGFVSSYSTHGASLLVSAFGSPGEVVTTDRIGSGGYNSNGDYTSGFSGTSAAAPMVSGVVALMLEANPDLDWRDVQEILAYSARHVGSDIGSGTSGSEEYAWAFNGANDWNGGGLHFSNDYGFGLVDAKAAVRLAETWGSEPESSFDTITAIVDLVDASTTILQTGTTFVKDTRINVEVEHVEVDVSFTQWYDLGDLEMRLISPSGTSSILIQNSGENSGTAAGGFDSGRWKFSSNAFRGENSLGDWTLKLFDKDSTTRSPITVNDIDVKLHGGIDKAEDTFIFTTAFSDYAGTFGHTKALDGGSGVDTLNAAAVDSSTSINLAAGQGTIDGVAVTLAGMENVFTGDGDDILVGDAADNKLVGMRGNDYLDGGSGNDTLVGGKGNDWIVGGNGNDTMYGGLGDDVFTVHSASSKTIELAGYGNDTVYTYVDYALADNIENMTLRAAVYRGRGNSGDNTILGNGDQNLIEGLGGNDNLHGYYGDDILDGGAGDDYLNGGYDHDELIGGMGDDTLAGNNGDDVLTGGAGSDRLLGGVGADTFIFEAITDGLDLITDFSQLQNDALKILSRGFGGSLQQGLLHSSQFVLGSASTSADSRFLYHQASGSLQFDADGTGSAVATKIATLSNRAELSHSDISIA